MRFRVLLLALLLMAPTLAEAEWHVKPFLGVTWGGSTTFVDPEHAAGSVTPALGVSGLWLGEVFGVEGDYGQALGFFQAGDLDLVQRSRVFTVTGNVIVAVPRQWTEYTLRPYFVAGMGAMRVRIDAQGDLLTASTLTALNAGAGVSGFLTERVGLNWEFRRFWSVAGKDRGEGLSIGPEQLSFWRASMGLAFRY